MRGLQVIVAIATSRYSRLISILLAFAMLVTVLRTLGFGYDDAGNRTSETTPEGHTTHRTYDAAGRLTKLTEPVSSTENIETTFGYDAAGQRTRLTDGRGNATITTYNTLGLPEKVIEPATAAHNDDASRTWTTSYDATGNPVNLAKPGGVTVTSTFDELGRLTKQSGTGGETSTPDTRFGYDLAGNRLRVSAPGNDILFTYNDRGLPLSSITAGDKTTQFAYDPNGRLSQRTDPAGTTAITWNGQDQVATTTGTITGGTDTRTYDDAGRLTDIATQYGSTTAHRTFAYDDLDRLTSDQLKSPDGTVLASIAYGYNLDGNLTSKTTTGTAGAGDNTYTYDDAGRLASWTDPADQQTQYGWDAAGNRTKAGATTYTYDERNRLTSDGTHTYTYSARGTLTSDGANTLTWDAFDRLTAEAGATFTYDGLDRVATRTQGSATQTFLYATGQNDLTAILDGSGTPTSGYERTPAGGILGIRQNNQNYRTYSDRHDDLTALYDPGVSTLNGSTAYNPNGQPTATNGTTSLLGYQGEYTDPGSDRVNMAARWYTPGTANFASRDDWTLDPNPSVQANRYTYANATPLNATDPTGHFGIGGVGLGVGLALSADLGIISGTGAGAGAAAGVGAGVSLGGVAAGAGLAVAGGAMMGGLGYAMYRGMKAGTGSLRPGWSMSLPCRSSCAPTYPWGPTGSGAGNGTGGAGRYGSPIRVVPPPPTPAQIQKKQAESARDHPKPRPPMVNTVTQRDIDRIRNSVESRVPVRDAVNVTGDFSTRLPEYGARPAVTTTVPTPQLSGQGGGRPPTGTVAVGADDCSEAEIYTSAGCEDPLDTLKRVVNDLREQFVKNPESMRRWLSEEEIASALAKDKGWLARVNFGKAVERAAAEHPDIANNFLAVGGRSMPDFVGLRNLLMYEVTTNTPSAFFSHINRPYVDPRFYIGYRQVPFGAGRLPRLPLVEPKFP